MLILGRRTNQSIVFPSCGITVRILDVNGKITKVGIEAARHVEVLRGELVESISTSPSRSFAKESEHSPLVIMEEPLLQLSQRVADLKAGLHAFQQLRARGEEAEADSVLTEVLEEIALLDKDCLENSEQAKRTRPRFSTDRVSEHNASYNRNASTTEASMYILIVNCPSASGYTHLPNGCFHGCQISNANNMEIVQTALANNEPFDFIICNGDLEGSSDFELVKLVRSLRTYDHCRLFVTRNSNRVLEQLDHSNRYGIDGWLANPLDASDLWSHIVESQQIEA